MYVAMLRDGYSRGQAAKRCGISYKAAAAFHDGDPSSSGVRWLRAQRGEIDLPSTEPAAS